MRTCATHGARDQPSAVHRAEVHGVGVECTVWAAAVVTAPPRMRLSGYRYSCLLLSVTVCYCLLLCVRYRAAEDAVERVQVLGDHPVAVDLCHSNRQ